MVSDSENVVGAGEDPQPIQDIVVIKDRNEAHKHADIAAIDFPRKYNVVLRYWTDASRRSVSEEGPVGAAVCVRSLVHAWRLDGAIKCHNATTSAVGELKTIALALDHAEEEYKKMDETTRSQVRVELFCDSTHALEKIRQDRECESFEEVTICKDILESLRKLPVEKDRVHMFFCPAHQGNPGNERADEKAGNASKEASNIPGFPLPRKVVILPRLLRTLDPELGLAPLVWSPART